MSAASSSSASLSAGAPGAPKEYPAGSIVRIHCYQFLTCESYAHRALGELPAYDAHKVTNLWTAPPPHHSPTPLSPSLDRDVTITPGARLNMVVGPNGTGKSSIVCAIAIGLGCKLRDLGRSETLGEFVMQVRHRRCRRHHHRHHRGSTAKNSRSELAPARPPARPPTRRPPFS